MNENNQKMRELCSCGKRVSKVCPLEIGKSTLFFCDETASYTLVCSLTNTLTSSGADSVTSAVLVIRAHRSDGSDITFLGKEYVAKTLSFTKEGLCAGNSSGNLAFKLDLDDAAVADIEIYVTKTVFVSGIVSLFQRNEFYSVPDEPVPIKNAFLASDAKKFTEIFGERAKYVPEKLSSLVWRCTCSEICMDTECPVCKAQKSAVFDASQRAIDARENFIKKGRAPLIISFGVIVLILLSLIIAIPVINSRNAGGQNDPSGTDSKDTTAEVTTNRTYVKEMYDLSKAYLEREMFDSALEVARKINHTALIDEILSKASEKAISENDFIKASFYALQMKEPTNLNTVLEGAYTQSIDAKDYKNALSFAKKLGDSAKITESATLLSDLLLSEKKYNEAFAVAAENALNEKAEKIASDATSHYIESGDYASAMDFANKTGDDKVIRNTAKAAALALIDEKKYVDAFEYAVLCEDSSVAVTCVSKMKQSELGANIGKYFKYMSFERKQEALANKLSASSTVAAIATDGKVYYGATFVYAPESARAVSVASGAAHTAILMDDGTVVALGDNSFGQCDVSEWKGVVAVSAGEFHTVALLEDGSVLACGMNSFGQIDTFKFEDIVMISAGSYHTVGMKADGTAVACGMNFDKQCDLSGFSDLKMISAGQTHTLGLKKDGTVISAGSALMGQADVQEWKNVIYVSAGDCFSVGLTAKGEVLVCGRPVNTGTVENAQLLSSPASISSGNVCVATIDRNGKLWVIGSGAPDVSHLAEVQFEGNNFFILQ